MAQSVWVARLPKKENNVIEPTMNVTAGGSIATGTDTLA